MSMSLDAKASTYRDPALLIARILVGILFLIAAYNKMKGIGGTAGYFGRLGIPAPEVMVWVALAIEIIGGILLIVGYQTRLAALMLGVFVVVAALIAHTNFADGNQLNHFLKNLAIAGGCLALFCTGAGEYSADEKM